MTKTRSRHIPKRATRHYRVGPEPTTMAAIRSLLAAQPPSVHHVVFDGSPTFLRSGQLASVELVMPASADGTKSALYRIRDDGVLFEKAWLPKTRGAVALRFAGSTNHYRMTEGLRSAWIMSLGDLPGESVIAFYGALPPCAGERYYLESLPHVVGSDGIATSSWRRVSFRNIAFVKPQRLECLGPDAHDSRGFE